MKKIRFSIVIIAYNIQEYIEDAIMSVEKQNFKNIEIIVVDDKSEDGTGAKIANLCLKYNNITYIKHNINKGAGGARNTALNIAKGEYIIFLDGDDTLAEDNVLERLDNVILKDKVDIVYLGFIIKGDVNKVLVPSEDNCGKTYRAAIDKYPNPWSKCWRKDFLNENNIRFPERRRYEDVLFVYNGVMKSKSYKFVDFITHNYNAKRAGSATFSINIKNVEDTLLNLEDLVKIRDKNYTKEVDMIIQKEVKFCKERLDYIIQSIVK